MENRQRARMAQAVKHALVGPASVDYEVMQLYQVSPDFHTTIDMIANAAPFLIEALTEVARRSEAARRLAYDQINLGIVPDLDHLEP